MEKTQKNRIFAAIVMLLTLFAAMIGGQMTLPAFAATLSSDVLEDLKKDETFDSSAYPSDSKNYKVQVIQIAETTEGGLCIYTYQPSQLSHYLVATDINMSLSESADGTQLYGLTLLSCRGTLANYQVNDFKVSEAEKRYYNISSIYREFDRYIDAPAQLDNATKKVAQVVGKLFIAETVDGAPVYLERKQETIGITDKYVGNILYEGNINIGWGISRSAINAFYVAFDTDRRIEKLYEADVTYSTQSLQYKVKANVLQFWNNYKIGSAYDVQHGEKIPHDPVTLSYNRINSAGNYSWDQIQSVDEFKANLSKNGMELTTDAEEGLRGKKWVLNFASESCEVNSGNGWIGISTGLVGMMFTKDPTVRTTQVGDVSILRLKFETDGKLYNLGAVDGVTTGSGKPSNRLPGYDENNENFSVSRFLKDKTGVSLGGWIGIAVAVLAVVAVIVLACVYPPFAAALGKFFGAIGTGVLYVLQGVWWLVCLPFKKLAELAEKNKAEKRQEEIRNQKASKKKAKTKSESSKKTVKSKAS